MAHLDAVLSLAEVSAQPGFSRPQFHDGASTPSFIRLKNARHPCLAQTYQGGEYIPNDATLGAAPAGIADDAPAAPNMLLLTGPNMGGKSTLLRQTCLVAILAQVKNQPGAAECSFRFSLVPSSNPVEHLDTSSPAECKKNSSSLRSFFVSDRWAALFPRTRRTSRHSTGFSQGSEHQTVSWPDSRPSLWSSARLRTFFTTLRAGASSSLTNWVSTGSLNDCVP